MDIAVCNPGFDANGIIGVVSEGKFRAAPADSCVHAQRHVAGNVAVRQSVDNLKIRNQTAVVDGGGNLTDTTAQRGDSLAAGIGRCVLVASFLCALAHDGVEVKLFTGIQNCAIDGLTCQIQIDVALFVGGMLSLVFAENIPENNVLDCTAGGTRGNHGHGNGKTFTVVGGLQLIAGFLNVETVTVDFHSHFVGLVVDLRILAFLDILCNDSVQNDGFGNHFLSAHIDDHIELIKAVSVQNPIVGALNIHIAAGNTHVENQILAGGICVEVGVICIKNGHFTFHSNGGGDIDAVKGSAIVVQLTTNIFQVQRQIGQQCNGVLGVHRGCHSPIPFFLGAGTAIVVGSFHSGIYIQFGTGICRAQGNGSVGELNHHGLNRVSTIGCGPNGGFCLSSGHVADVDTSYRNIVEDLAVIGICGGKKHKRTNNCKQKHSCHSAKTDQQNFTGFLGRKTVFSCLGLAVFRCVEEIIRNHRFRIWNDRSNLRFFH